MCGYSKCLQALEFHHLDPTEKDGGLAGSIKFLSKEKLLAEIEKCVLLCANCHREVEYNLVSV